MRSGKPRENGFVRDMRLRVRLHPHRILRSIATTGPSIGFTMNWQLSLAAALLLPLLLLVSLRFVHRIRPIYRAYRKDRADIDGRVVETFGGIRVVRAFGRERTEALRYVVRYWAEAEGIPMPKPKRSRKKNSKGEDS